MNCRNTQTGTLNIRQKVKAQTAALQSTMARRTEETSGWSRTVSHLCNEDWGQEGIISCGQRDQGVKLTIRLRALSKMWKRVVKKRNSSTNCHCCNKWNQHQRHTQFGEHMQWTLSCGCSRSTPPYLSVKKGETVKVFNKWRWNMLLRAIPSERLAAMHLHLTSRSCVCVTYM
jgi:hypothetical protein